MSGLSARPAPSAAMPPFAEAYGVSCNTCHTQVPLLNAYGRYVQRTGYASLDREVLARALPVWLDESLQYDATAGAGTGTPRYSFGNFAVHGVGYAAPDFTYHAQQWIVAGNESGSLDTLWVTYNNLLRHDGHLFIGKVNNPAPSPYSQDYELDSATASSTLVGEHDWSATYNNRWGTRLAYVRGALDAEAAYLLSSDDLNGISDFRPGDKTLQWKLAYARPTLPVEVGLFGSDGSIPVSTGTDIYSSAAAYLQIDPSNAGRPGIFAVYQTEKDGNPGVDSNTGSIMPATSSRGASVEIYQRFFRDSATFGIRHDFNDNGFGTLSNGDAINVAFNFPHFNYAHVYFEVNTGADSALAGGSWGPTWKGMFWLTLPLSAVH